PKDSPPQTRAGLLAQVVGAGLEAEPEYPNSLLAGFNDLVQCVADLQLIASEYRVDERHVQVHFARAVLQRTDVLGKARTAEREARLEVVRRDIQLLIAAEDLHDFVAVDADSLAEVADLVGKDDFHRMPRVACVLHHLGNADTRRVQRRLNPVVKGPRRCRIPGMVVADQCERRMLEVLQRRSFSKEFGIDGDTEPFTIFLARMCFECRDDVTVCRPGEDRASYDDNVIGRLVLEGIPDLLADADQILQIQTAVLAAWA